MDGPVAISASDLKLRPNQPDFEKPYSRNLLPSKSSRARWLLSTSTLSNRTASFTFRSSVPDSLRKPRDLIRTICYLYRRLVLPLNLWLPSYLLNICHSFQRKVTVARDAWSIPIHGWVQVLGEPVVYGSLHSTHGWPKPLMGFCRLISGLVWWLRSRYFRILDLGPRNVRFGIVAEDRQWSAPECWMPMTELQVIQAGGYSLNVFWTELFYISASYEFFTFLCMLVPPSMESPPLPIPLVDFRPWPRVTGSTSIYRVPWIGSLSMENATPPKGWEYSTSGVYYNVGCLLPGHSM